MVIPTEKRRSLGKMETMVRSTQKQKGRRNPKERGKKKINVRQSTTWKS